MASVSSFYANHRRSPLAKTAIGTFNRCQTFREHHKYDVAVDCSRLTCFDQAYSYNLATVQSDDSYFVYLISSKPRVYSPHKTKTERDCFVTSVIAVVALIYSRRAYLSLMDYLIQLEEIYDRYT